MGYSPMMLQYFDVKEKYADCILMFRLGDFYEMFFEDALTASKVLDLTLTGRDCGVDERAPMCGVPYHSVDSYLAKLVENNYKVAICEQVTLPGDAKGIVKREVVRVVSPGTVLSTEMLKNDKNNYLCSVFSGESAFGIAWSDISTGEFNFSECENIDSLINLLQNIMPAEIICNGKMQAETFGLDVSKLPIFALFMDWAYEYNTAKEKVLSQNQNLDSFKNKPNAICASGALIEYINQTQKMESSNIRLMTDDSCESRLEINLTAKRTLELTDNAIDGKRKGTLLGIIDKTQTSMGARMMRKWIEKPLCDIDAINTRANSVEELFRDTINRDKLGEILNKINDIERLSSKFAFLTANPKDCVALLNSLQILPEAKILLSQFVSPLLVGLREEIDTCGELCSLLKNAFVDNPPRNARDGDFIRSEFDEQVAEYRRLKTDSSSILRRMEDAEREETGIKNLKIGFNKVFGYYIEVNKTQTASVPYRYVRKQTVANNERYITDELKELETNIVGAEEKLLARELEIYENIVKKVCESVKTLLKTANAIANIDCIYSLARVGKELNFVKPIISDDGSILIKEGRHPIVEQSLKNEEFVPNDTSLDFADNRIMIITGPNMAGKSVYMRQVALIVIMAHIGSFVPAKEAKICLTDKIFTRVGASDDLSTGRSTFMVEMTEMSDILKNATDKSLILLDEVGRGTSTYDGLSIAWAIIDYLSQKLKAKTLFSTHYHELTELEGVLAGVKNYKLTVREVGNTIVFLRKLLRGGANKSFGIEVASIAGLPKNIIEKAKDILKKLENMDLGKRANLSQSQQISMYNNPTANTIIELLKEIDIDEVSAKQAHLILSDLIEKANS